LAKKRGIRKGDRLLGGVGGVTGEQNFGPTAKKKGKTQVHKGARLTPTEGGENYYEPETG